MLSAKCSSLWLIALLIQEQGFYLHKQEFQDVLWLRYGWELARVPSHCVCGASFSVDHAMICRHGGLTFICHNELRDLTASWLHEVGCDVAVKPHLQPLTSGGSRNSERGFQLIVDPKRRGLGAHPPAAEEVSIFKSIQSNEKFNIFPIDNSKLWLATLTYSS